MLAWRRDSLELPQERREARARFFGDDDPTPIKHWPGAEEVSSEMLPLGAAVLDLGCGSGRGGCCECSTISSFCVMLVPTSWRA
jgi:hypothetical protein